MTRTTELPFPYSIKRHSVSVMSCDDEPVQTPGCIQSHGLLLAMHPDTCIVTQVSENCARWTARAVDATLGQPLADIIGAGPAQRIRQLLDGEELVNNPTYAVTTRLPGMAPEDAPLDISVHLSGGMLIVELEPTGRETAAAAPDRDYYTRVKKTMTRLRASTSLAGFCDAIAQEVRGATGLDRAMVYRFHDDESGEIVADAHRDDLHSWLGLRYPASDIPKPAREIFKRISIRPLPDASAELCEIVPLLDPASGRPLDMTYCALRGASVMYTEYLANMGVAATLTMPILRDGVLWGLIVCHNYTPTTMPYDLRAAAEFIGQIASLEIAAAESREHAQYQLRIDTTHHAMMTRMVGTGDMAELTQGAPGLLDGIEASGVATLCRDQWLVVGRTPPEFQLQQLALWLRERLLRDGKRIVVTDALGAAYPLAAQFADMASGMLAVAVSGSLTSDLIIWFRPEQMQTFTWSGNPYDKPQMAGPNGMRLTPRRSFDIWQEEVRGRSQPWKQVEIDAALKLRQWIGDLMVGRAEQLDRLNGELSRSNDELDAFAYVAGHDLKEPLRGIYKNAYYLKQENDASGTSDTLTNERFSTLLRLTVRMDSLLDALLHFARVGRLSLDYEPVDLGVVVGEALDMLGSRLTESGVQVRLPRPLPVVQCDRVRAREIFANLISNAVKYNDKPAPLLEIGYVDAGDINPAAPWPLASSPVQKEALLFYVRDNGIGIEHRHQERVFQIFKRLHPRDAFGGGSGAGLAIARKLVEQHNGRIWFDSTPGVGTTFYFTLEGPPVVLAERRRA
ncbi:ATP-binding protein [Actimicrobium antarcticum]|uniref:histidine kinase n=1 Tax=Actimicrobium antarcticum TaxID=1051899 RepID=A0ABP7TXR6_9BURK